MNEAWWQSRYDRGTPDYINCAKDKAQYEAFIQELTQAEEAPVHGFEDRNVFEGCMPVEVMARRGVDTLRYGPLKPVGLPPGCGYPALRAAEAGGPDRPQNRPGAVCRGAAAPGQCGQDGV